MGTDWDPDEDGERRKAGRARWVVTIAIVLVVLGTGAMLIYEHGVHKARREAMFR